METFKSNLKSQKAITLVALVVTIVVLLILAGITITVLFSDNGVIKTAQDASEKNKIAEARSKLDLAMADWQVVKRTENKTFENHLKDAFGDANVAASGESFNVKIDGYTFTVKDDGTITVVGGGTDVTPGGDEEDPIPEGTYSIAGVTPSPMDLFYYEPISTTTGKLASTEPSGLPEKKARITGIKGQYCSNEGIAGYPDSNYEIIYNGTKISDSLVIPYKVKIGEEMYTVTEVSLKTERNDYYGAPDVRTIIYPNTVETILQNGTMGSRIYKNIKNIILPNKLKVLNIQSLSWQKTSNDIEVWIPKSVTTINQYAFGLGGDSGLFTGKIKFEGTEQEWNTLSGKNSLIVEFNCPMPTTIPQSGTME